MKKLSTFLGLIVFFIVAFSVSVSAQKAVSGTITDANNSPLIGATVMAQGTTVGTITDIDGNYTLTLPAGVDAIVVSYTGYETKTMTVDGNTANIFLSSGALLDEVVVVGYGAVQRKDVTGSVASLKAEDFNQGLVISSDQLLQGRVPGVNMINNSGQPGGEATVKIRGNNSIRSGANPLYVVDGVPLDGRTAKASAPSTGEIGSIANSNPLNFINPSDIASIEVLKDASSAAIYGARASNGVILITTKKARAGELDVNFNTSFGTSSILKKYEVLTGDEYRAATSAYGLGGNGGSSVDAFDAILQNGTIQNYNVSVGTGGENSKTRISAGYQDVKGIIKESGLKRYNATINSQYNLWDDRAGVDFFVVSSHTNEDIAPISTNAGFRGNLVGQALQWNPTVPLMTGDEFSTNLNNEFVGATTINPIHYLAAYNEVANTTTILGSISPYVNITDNLQYRYRFGVNYGTGTTRVGISQDINVTGIEGLGMAGIANNQLVTNLHSHTLNYTTDISDGLDLSLLGGYEYQKFNFRGFGFNAFGFDNVPNDFDLTNALQNSNNDSRNVFSYADPLVELQSFFARVGLGIGDRFDITATVRADGSTKFGDNEKYGIFPSAALRWNLINEGFLSNSSLFDDLALRIGWGKTGNQEFPAGSAINRFGLSPNSGISQENIGNPDLRWEESSTFNVGLEFAIIDYVLSGTIEYYNRVTSNLLLDPFVQEPGPAIRLWKNIDGELLNSGVELGLNAFVVNTDNLDVNIGANISFLNNELSGYTGPDILTGNLFGQGSSGAFVQKHTNGLPLNTFFVRDFQGLDESGNSIHANDGALIEAGDPNADVVLGLSLGIDAGKLGFNMNWNGAYGHTLFNNTAMSVIPIGNLGSRNVDAALIDGTSESVANPISSSTRYLESGNFTKLANASLTYSLGSIRGLRDLSLSLTGNNILVITDYSGFDPEINTVNLRDGIPSSGIEYIPYPSARSFLIGLNASF